MKCTETNNILFPDDLFEGILLRMPVRDLLRLRCVSKSWCSLIDDSSFIRKHHDAQYAIHKAATGGGGGGGGDVPLFLWDSNDNLCYLYYQQEGESEGEGEGDDIVLNLTSDFERDILSLFTGVYPTVRLHGCKGSANGIICLTICLTIHKYYLLLDWL